MKKNKILSGTKIKKAHNFKFSNSVISISLIVILLLLNVSCKNENDKANQPKPKKAPLVKVQKVESSKMTSSIDITGTIQANNVTEVKSPADGIIEGLFARENQYVTKNKLIAIINPTDRVSLISSSSDKVSGLQRKLKSIDQSSEEYQKMQSQIENAKSDFQFAQNMYKTIRVISPMNGLVTQRTLDKGSQVSIKENIITITDMASLVIKADINEKYFESIKQGKKLPILLSAYPNDTLTGIISLIYPGVDPMSRSIKFDIKIQNFNRPLLPGMMASIKIPVAVLDDALSIPEYAILTSPDSKNFVFIVDADSIAHKKGVQTGITSGNKIQIISGLKSSDKIVISGQDMLKDSVKVKIMGTPKGDKK